MKTEEAIASLRATSQSGREVAADLDRLALTFREFSAALRRFAAAIEANQPE